MQTRSLIAALFLTAIRAVEAGTFVVTTTDSTGGGSILEAFLRSTDGSCPPPCHVVFNIRGPVPRSGYFTIESAISIAAPGMVLDGTTQTAFSGDTNAAGPEILISGKTQRIGVGLTVYSTSPSGPLGGQPVTDCEIKNLAITGFPADAILVAASRCLIEGNYIGVDPTGKTATPNGGGIGVLGDFNVIRNNVIGGNNAGLTLGGKGNRVVGNIIGADTSGQTPIPNNMGIDLRGIDGQIGSAAPGDANRIAFNLLNGISLVDSGVGNEIRGNSICCNGGLGIDLVDWVDSGVTRNDLGDVDTGRNRGRYDEPGTNNLQNFPVLGRVRYDRLSNQLAIEGSLNSTASTAFNLDFYGSEAPDPSGFGEGDRYLGTHVVTTDAAGNASFIARVNFDSRILFVTSTATRVTSPRDTSEFSNAVRIETRRRIVRR